ncbi:MAG TPA: TIGR02466 family protein [Rhizomicrobium sp.]|nr:TIGR02466 family protein [Rhizomicrobium sp.]
MADSRIEMLFATRLYRAGVARARALNAELAKTCLIIARDDHAGRRWSKEHGYRGYTSYASLNDLPLRAPVFADLVKRLDIHVRDFARTLEFDLMGATLAQDSLWINVMDKGGVHAAHIHPHSVISGTYYVAVPKGASAIRFEDPRLAMMMAAPAKRTRASRANQSFVTVAPRPGTVLLWESFLRHDVPPNTARGARISVSFNYALR